MALGEARIEIIPDVSGFEKALTSAVESAMAGAKGAADDAASEIAGSFDSAASEAEASLSSVDGDGFSEAAAAADSASAEVSGAFDAASSEADAALASVDGDGFSEAVGAAEQAGGEIADAMQDSAEKSKKAFQDADFGKLIQGAFATAAIAGFTRSLIGAAEAGSTSRARIQQIATSMNIFGDEVGNVTSRLSDYADTTARATGVDDDSIMATQAKLLTFRELAVTAGDVGGAFDRATAAAIDLAAAGFGSAESNAVQLGKALQDPIKGVTALARAGVTFTEQEKEKLRVLVETNQIAEAQNVILTALETQVGGTAVATANATDKMRVAWDQAKEGLGQALLPALDMLTSVLQKATELFLGLPEPVQKLVTVVGLGAAAFYAASRALQGLGLAAGNANKALGAIGLVLTAAAGLYAVYSSRKREAEKVTNDFVEALRQEEQGQKGALAALIANEIASNEYLAIREDIGISERDLVDIITGRSNPALEAQIGYLREVIDGTLSWDMKTLELRKNLGITSFEAAQFLNAIDDLTNGYRTGQEELDRLNQAQAATEAALIDTRSAAQDYADSLARLDGLTQQANRTEEEFAALQEQGRQALEDKRIATEQAEQALWDLLDATLAQFNSELALEGQITRTNDALGAYAQAQADATSGKIAGEEAARAIADAERTAAEQALSMAASAARLAEDQAKASGATLTAAESARIQRDNLAVVAASLDPNSPLRKRLQAYIDELENQIPRDIQTNLEARVNITGNALQFVRTGQVVRTSEGGVFSLPQTRLIAEAGSEAVIPITRPARAMELLETSGLADLVRSQGGGPAVMIQSATFADATDADLVAQRVNTALRVRSFA